MDERSLSFSYSKVTCFVLSSFPFPIKDRNHILSIFFIFPFLIYMAVRRNNRHLLLILAILLRSRGIFSLILAWGYIHSTNFEMTSNSSNPHHTGSTQLKYKEVCAFMSTHPLLVSCNQLNNRNTYISDKSSILHADSCRADDRSTPRS